MKEVDVSKLTEDIEWIESHRSQLDHSSGLDARLRKDVAERLSSVLAVCRQLCLPYAAGAIETALRWFDPPYSPKDSSASAAVHLEHVEEAVRRQLSDIRFFALAVDRVEYYDNVDRFGKDAVQAFPSAESDIREGMRCLGLELNTAAVFHFMRVAEQGLRALANDRQIQLPKGKPMELASWEEIIRQLEDSEKMIHNYPATLAREQQYEFYHGALMEVRRFKNVFRNRVAHTRDEYDRDQALSVFNHVSQFMNILASKISESTSTLPQIWA